MFLVLSHFLKTVKDIENISSCFYRLRNTSASLGRERFFGNTSRTLLIFVQSRNFYLIDNVKDTHAGGSQCRVTFDGLRLKHRAFRRLMVEFSVVRRLILILILFHGLLLTVNY